MVSGKGSLYKSSLTRVCTGLSNVGHQVRGPGALASCDYLTDDPFKVELIDWYISATLSLSLGLSLRFRGLRLASKFLKQSQNDLNVFVVRR